LITKNCSWAKNCPRSKNCRGKELNALLKTNLDEESSGRRIIRWKNYLVKNIPGEAFLWRRINRFIWKVFWANNCPGEELFALPKVFLGEEWSGEELSRNQKLYLTNTALQCIIYHHYTFVFINPNEFSLPHCNSFVQQRRRRYMTEG
jgi:hypothetical protein